MNENYGKLSASEIRDHSTGLGRMRTLLGYYMVLQGISVLVLFLTVLALYEEEFAVNLLTFIIEHNTVTMILSVFSAGIAILYYAEMLSLHRFETGLLAAGALGLVSFLYGNTGNTLTEFASFSGFLSKDYYSTIVTHSFIVLIIEYVFRRTYCTTMARRTDAFSSETSWKWGRLWDLTRKVYLGAAIAIVLLRASIEHLSKSDESDYYLASRENYTTAIAIAIGIAALCAVVNMVLQYRERECLKSTIDSIYIAGSAPSSDEQPYGTGM